MFLRTKRFFAYILFVCFFLLISFNSQAFDFFNSRNITSDHYHLNVSYPKDNNRVDLNWSMSKGNYLYKDRVSIKILNNNNLSNNLSITALRFPSNYHNKNTVIGNYAVYSHELKLPVILNKTPNKNFAMSVTFQGCSDSGFCYAPITNIVNIDVTNHKAFAHTKNNLTNNLKNITDSSSGSGVNLKSDKGLLNNNNINLNNHSSSAFGSQIFAHSIFVIISICFGLGLLLSFTPCVLPMVPILSSIILGQKSVSMKRGFSLSLIYVLSMALTYTALGVLVSLVGQNFQLIFQKPIFLISLAIVFIILSLGLLGFFNLKVFKVFNSSNKLGINKLGISYKINQFSMFLNNRVKGGSYLGVFGMGVVATIIVSPCVTPPLVGILVYISQSGNVFLGGVALFALGLGMGVPLLIVGTLGPKFLPKRGSWMNIVKMVFAILLLAVAGSLFWRALPISSNSNSNSHSNSNSGFNLKSNNIYVTNLRELNLSLNKAKSENKPAIIDFYADWCLSCKIMDVHTFSDPKVKKNLEKFVFIHVNMTTQTKDVSGLQKKFNIIAPPSIIFYKSGKFLNQYDILGEIGPNEFNKTLLKVIG